MDLPKAPTQGDVNAAGGIWNWIVFFFSLIVSGGLLEYLVSKRYVTRKEWQSHQEKCTEHLKTQFELALLKNNERLEERMISAVSKAIKDSLSDRRKDDDN